MSLSITAPNHTKIKLGNAHRKSLNPEAALSTSSTRAWQCWGLTHHLCVPAVPPMGMPSHGDKEAAVVGARSPSECTRSHHHHPFGASRAAAGERGALRSLSPCALLTMGKQGQMEPHPSPRRRGAGEQGVSGAGSSRLAPATGTASVPGSRCQMVSDTRVFTRRQQSPRQEQSVL